MEERFSHRPVLLSEVIRFLDPGPSKIIIDATLGGAGHAEKIVKHLQPDGLLIGIDRDLESLKMAVEKLGSGESTSFKLLHRNFKDIKHILRELHIGEVDGILFDLGISSIQLETAERGFSIKHNGPLDMRMDRNQTVTAKELVNNLSEEELERIIRDYGEDRYYRRIARAIVKERAQKMIQTTRQLADIISRSVPYNRSKTRIHPATRTFQALRIEVNDELFNLRQTLQDLPYCLKVNGCICIISYHSLEDRVVKHSFKKIASQGSFRLLTKKPVTPQEAEILKNPRSRSAKLRAIQRIS